ncbi:MAG: hypothetical protein LBS57_09230 [Treponema sp.]|jgi:hypothetical protein|nr:hypothetical protein [Treponema sp.]
MKKMAKKIFVFVTLMAVCGAALFAQEEGGKKRPGIFSAGLGGAFTANFSNYVWTSDGKNALKELDLDENWSDENLIGGGFFVFFDAKYVEADLGMSFFGITAANKDSQKALDDAKTTLSMTDFEIQILGKYPIALGNRLSIFPLLGVDFKIVLVQNTTIDGKEYAYEDYALSTRGRDPVEWLSTVWFKLGIGADIALTNRIYLRPEFLYGIGTNNKSQTDIMDKGTKTIDGIVNHGLDARLALGYRF